MKRFAIAALVLVASLSIVGCVPTTKLDGAETQMFGSVRVWTDEATGVEYVIVQTNYGSGICPRYNPDGSIRVVDE